MQFEHMNLKNRKSVTNSRVLFSSVAMLITVLFGQTAFATDGEIYKTISDDGATLFTDKPVGNSTTLAPLEPNILTNTTRAQDSQDAENDDGNESEPADSPAITVTSVRITNPRNEQTIINPRGPILISIATGPDYGMPEGYTAEIKMDGKVVSSGEGTLLSIPPPDRGTHTIEAVVLNSSGTVQAISQKVTVHVKRSVVRKEE
jgi:hypothetical protein